MSNARRDYFPRKCLNWRLNSFDVLQFSSKFTYQGTGTNWSASVNNARWDYFPRKCLN